MKEKTFIAIDLKSFYASVECMERGLDPMDTNLVVADPARTDKTICLAVTPSLKSFGIPGRCRLFEVKQRVKEVNVERKLKNNGTLEGKSISSGQLMGNPSLSLDFIIAAPRMAYYIEYSTKIYDIYMKYVAPEDIVVYSIDEVFMDITNYLKISNLTAYDFAMKIITDVLENTGITATCGIGTNLYLCKIAMDIVAKHVPPDNNGVRIASLNEMEYRRQLWEHEPITDFWRVGKGYAAKLKDNGMMNMGDVALASIYNENLLYKIFGVNAELLIDHAWGWEPCQIADIKAYRPENNCLCSGQVLQEPVDAETGKIIIKEMADMMALDLVEKGLVTNQLVITIGYDRENINNPNIDYNGEITVDFYGRAVPKHAHGTERLGEYTSSGIRLMEASEGLYDRIINKNLTIRRLNIEVNVVHESELQNDNDFVQMNLFTDFGEGMIKKKKLQQALERERKLQEAAISIKRKYGKNAILKGMNLSKGATAMERNKQIGGHRA